MVDAPLVLTTAVAPVLADLATAQDLFEGDIVMFPVVKPHYWALELVDFRHRHAWNGLESRLFGIGLRLSKHPDYTIVLVDC